MGLKRKAGVPVLKSKFGQDLDAPYARISEAIFDRNKEFFHIIIAVWATQQACADGAEPVDKYSLLLPRFIKSVDESQWGGADVENPQYIRAFAQMCEGKLYSTIYQTILENPVFQNWEGDE